MEFREIEIHITEEQAEWYVRLELARFVAMHNQGLAKTDLLVATKPEMQADVEESQQLMNASVLGALDTLEDESLTLEEIELGADVFQLGEWFQDSEYVVEPCGDEEMEELLAEFRESSDWDPQRTARAYSALYLYTAMGHIAQAVEMGWDES